ncbi:long-chain fatty acid--CoA ligase [Altererythrobacter sp. CC-YST694]|uniref:long-chain-fatty-acid--CoA ligase n=1 Tax=Altererythrobacter sp. CC-YST694 TaxID=2755038 RepID=UPI001D00890E|nr:long-chain fatty acid--CoA ligase [Altererythrobacter sp. CC-YST694]MCB5425341.1 long-chain fatty acid--CoA ligase [Altererythrobacter sp. CC-YST694]
MDVSKAGPQAGRPDAEFRPAPECYNHPSPWELDLPPMTMPEMLEGSVAAHPAAHLLEFMGRHYSYAEVLCDARAFAAGLQKLGIGKGDRVGMFLPNAPIYVAAYYGAMMAGAIAVNFSPLYTVEELEAQVEDSGTRLLVTLDVPALLPTACKVLDQSSLQTLVVGRLADMLPWAKGAALRLFGRKSTMAVPRRRDVLTWNSMVVRAMPEPVQLDAEKDIALLQYSGGTTGVPKGAMLSHQNLTANARQVDAIDPFRTGPDIIMGVLPLFHVFANTCVLNRTVVKGGCLAMLPRFDAGQALKTMERVEATAFPGVPTMYQALLDHPRLASTDFSSLLVCISGGAPLPEPLHQRFEEASGARLVEGYGLTESSGVVSTNPYDGENRHGTIGQPLPETRIRLLDKEDPTRDAPPGEPGELAICGPQVMQGYWNRPEAAAAAFAMRDGERWLRTGDIAMLDPDFYIRIVDRSKDMITVGGFKVFPSQVEEVLLRHPCVKEVLVIAVPDDYLGERPAAFVTLAECSPPTDGEKLCNWANTHLGKHERLQRVEIRESLPKTPIGKLDRKALRREVLGEG